MTARAWRRVSNVLFALGLAFLAAALIVLLAGDANAQTTRPAPKPKPEAEEQPSTQSGPVYYPDLCTLVEEGSFHWYFMLCFLR